VTESEATVVNLRVQVIAMKSFTLDLQVPTYLPARDLTQRVARDAGLDAFWPDGRRRLYWLRARGRLLRDEEKLSDLGVINGELVYLLPEPPAADGVTEQQPEYPVNQGYAGAGLLALFGALALVVGWAVLWGAALGTSRSLWVTSLPGLALGLFCTSLARHAWGGRGTQLRIAVTALVFQMFLSVVAIAAPIVFAGQAPLDMYWQGAPGIILGMIGVFIGWLAWWGGVEPLPASQAAEQTTQAQVAAVVNCGICGLGIEQKVRSECVHACGQHFHQGCLKAKTSVYRGDASKCAVCGKKVA